MSEPTTTTKGGTATAQRSGTVPQPSQSTREEPRGRARRISEVTPVPDRIPLAEVDPSSAAAEAAALPIPFPPFLHRSGIYQLQPIILPPVPVPIPPIPPIPPVDGSAHNGAGQPGTQPAATAADTTGPVADTGDARLTPLFGTEELRVDVDGFKPTMTVSGTISRIFGGRLTWIARVTQIPATNTWTGPISYRDGNSALRPQDTVSVRLTGGSFLNRQATATFSGGGPVVTLNYGYKTAAFRAVAFEYDRVSDATEVTEFDPSTHPVHPPTAPTTTLTIASAYARVGIEVSKTGGDSVIDISEAGANTTWSDQEMHDAMQLHWSRWVDAPQWAAWVLFARLHDQGTTLGGIMFDDIGTAQRQGTAIFSGSFISQAPAGEADPGPWVQRMRFWTAVHEIGHTFNLAHSWQKSLGTAWMPLTDEPTAMSYMNYPFRYPGGTTAFFSAFDYTFSPQELFFLRHAPTRFVEQGAAPWFSDHGFEQDAYQQLRSAVPSPLELDIRVHHESRYEFLEPVVAELRLKNVSPTTVAIDANVLRDDALALVVAKEGGTARRWLPFARYCAAPEPTVLKPGEALYSSVFLSAGTGGWLISDPGAYQVFAAADLGEGRAALSAPLRLEVAPPADATAERLAGQVFTQDVAHTLAFGGSRVLDTANSALREVAEQLPGSQAAVHANAVLGTPMASDGKVLVVDQDGLERVAVIPSSPSEAQHLLSAALGDINRAADTLGHIGVAEQTTQLAAVLEMEGDATASAAVLDRSADALEQRGVLPAVVSALRQQG